MHLLGHPDTFCLLDLLLLRKAELLRAACAYNSTQTPPKRPSDTFG